MKTKQILSLAVAAMAAATPSSDACTNLIAGPKATTDGSVLITYAADSHELYGALQYLPAADHNPGDMRAVVEWDTGKLLGHIPEVAHTYAVMGNINEHQLTIAESTFGGRPELEDKSGTAIIDYGSLIYIALQRCKTAREAIKVMTDLVAEYGYASSGESFSIGDPNEVWIMEMMPKGGKEKGAVWVAMRLPDNAIAGHANQSRIYKFPLKDKQNCLYSKDVISFARSMGYYSGKDADFEFSTAYAPSDAGSLRGCDARVWSYYNRFAKGMDQYLPFLRGKKGAEKLPLWIVPDRKVNMQDLRDMMRDHFEGTPFDMTKDPGATNWWGVPYRYRPMGFEVDGEKYSQERAIATQQTGWVFVSQMRSWLPREIGGCFWFGVDDANTAVFVPIYCCNTEVPESYREGKGDLLTFDFDAAFWVNNLVANQAYNRYSLMIDDIRKVQGALEDSYVAQQAQVEAKAQEMLKSGRQGAIAYLTDYSVNTAQDATKQYQDLAKFLFVKYLDGNRKKEAGGKFERTETGYPAHPEFPGYTQDYYNTVARGSGDRLKVVEPEK